MRQPRLELSVNAFNLTDGCVASNVSYEWSIDDGNGPQITSDVTSVVVSGGNYDELDLVVVASQTSATNTCTAEVAQTLVIQGNPGIAPLSTDVALCPNSSAALSVEVLSDPNGGLTFAWANAGDECLTSSWRPMAKPLASPCLQETKPQRETCN